MCRKQCVNLIDFCKVVKLVEVKWFSVDGKHSLKYNLKWRGLEKLREWRLFCRGTQDWRQWSRLFRRKSTRRKWLVFDLEQFWQRANAEPRRSTCTPKYRLWLVEVDGQAWDAKPVGFEQPDKQKRGASEWYILALGTGEQEWCLLCSLRIYLNYFL